MKQKFINEPTLNNCDYSNLGSTTFWEELSIEDRYQITLQMLLDCHQLMKFFNLTNFVPNGAHVWKELQEAQKYQRIRKEIQIEEQVKQIVANGNEIAKLKAKINSLKLEKDKLNTTKGKLEKLVNNLSNTLKNTCVSMIQNLSIKVNKSLLKDIAVLTDALNYTFQRLQIDLKDNTDVKDLVVSCMNKSKVKPTKDKSIGYTLCKEAQDYLDEYYPEYENIDGILNTITQSQTLQNKAINYCTKIIQEELG